MTSTQEHAEAQVDEGPQLGFEEQLEEDGGVGEAETSQHQEEDGHGEVGAVHYTLDYYHLLLFKSWFIIHYSIQNMFSLPSSAVKLWLLIAVLESSMVQTFSEP